MTDTKAAAETCPFCDRLDEHQHEFFDALSTECEHEIARIRAENSRLLAELEQARAEREHLERGAKLLTSSECVFLDGWELHHDWLEVERARKGGA